MKKFTTETEYVSSLHAIDKDGKEVTRFNSQPYLTGGMYLCIEPGTIQITPTHKSYGAWVKGSIKKMEANGYSVTTTTNTYGAWFSQKEIDNYINS